MDSPALPIIDQAYLSGMGAFETIRAEAGLPLFLDAHLRRLEASAACFELTVPDKAYVFDAIRELLRRQALRSARIRLTLSGEIQPDGLPFRFGGTTRVTLIAFPIHVDVSKPMDVMISHYQLDAGGPLAGRKCTSYAINALAMREARDAGYDDAVMLNHSGHLVGCATGNLFWSSGGRVFTPCTSSGCRDGVTRERVMRACEMQGIPCIQVLAKPNELEKAQEAFVTSSIRGACSVATLDRWKFSETRITGAIRVVLQKELATGIT